MKIRIELRQDGFSYVLETPCKNATQKKFSELETRITEYAGNFEATLRNNGFGYDKFGMGDIISFRYKDGVIRTEVKGGFKNGANTDDFKRILERHMYKVVVM